MSEEQKQITEEYMENWEAIFEAKKTRFGAKNMRIDTIVKAVLVAFFILGASWMLSVVLFGTTTNFLGMV